MRLLALLNRLLGPRTTRYGHSRYHDHRHPPRPSGPPAQMTTRTSTHAPPPLSPHRQPGHRSPVRRGGLLARLFPRL